MRPIERENVVDEVADYRPDKCGASNRHHENYRFFSRSAPGADTRGRTTPSACPILREPLESDYSASNSARALPSAARSSSLSVGYFRSSF